MVDRNDWDSDENHVPEAYEKNAPHFDDTLPEELPQFLEQIERMMEIDETPVGEKKKRVSSQIYCTGNRQPVASSRLFLKDIPGVQKRSDTKLSSCLGILPRKLLVPPARLTHREAIQSFLSKLDPEFEEKIKEYLSNQWVEANASDPELESTFDEYCRAAKRVAKNFETRRDYSLYGYQKQKRDIVKQWRCQVMNLTWLEQATLIDLCLRDIVEATGRLCTAILCRIGPAGGSTVLSRAQGMNSFALSLRFNRCQSTMRYKSFAQQAKITERLPNGRPANFALHRIWALRRAGAWKISVTIEPCLLVSEKPNEMDRRSPQWLRGVQNYNERTKSKYSAVETVDMGVKETTHLRFGSNAWVGGGKEWHITAHLPAGVKFGWEVVFVLKQELFGWLNLTHLLDMEAVECGYHFARHGCNKSYVAKFKLVAIPALPTAGILGFFLPSGQVHYNSDQR
ncbi:hypothetical protein C8F04DRAFT_1197743 [Mycena alexandri]|uniref:Uncharacterized protein n=1 Tax=Mycena alexandri TaxID=1745969 RepID=A0AAD6S222_9AGAR|nr:hypothetical protein C8F04DRAFT_1197743 [Mycena alexandri]